MRTFVSSSAAGEIPEDWTVAIVVPFFKKGSRANPGNCRPVIGKLLERCFCDGIYTHVKVHGLIRILKGRLARFHRTVGFV